MQVVGGTNAGAAENGQMKIGQLQPAWKLRENWHG